MVYIYLIKVGQNYIELNQLTLNSVNPSKIKVKTWPKTYTQQQGGAPIEFPQFNLSMVAPVQWV